MRGGAVGVAVPRARCLTPDGNEREWQSQLLPRYRRSTPEVEQAVLGVYLSGGRSEEHTSELQSRLHLVCRLLLEKKKNRMTERTPPQTGRVCARRSVW